MTVTIEVYGVLATRLGRSRHELTVEGKTCTVAQATSAFCAEHPEIESVMPSVACALGNRIVEPTSTVHNGQTLVLLPPVSGG